MKVNLKPKPDSWSMHKDKKNLNLQKNIESVRVGKDMLW